MRRPSLPSVLPVALAVAGVGSAVLGMAAWSASPTVSSVDAPPERSRTITLPSPAATPPVERGTAHRVDDTWLNAMAARTGISVIALAAYTNAEIRITAEHPGCALGWTTLAGIGWVESQHGTLDGNALLAGGTTREPVLGPALDGSAGVAALRAQPEDTADHGNARWDHAVGPLQFIGSTWRRWGSDGDGDGIADRHDIDDAAYSAARYLCADGYDLATGAGWTAAVRSYNHSDPYVEAVRAAANRYGVSAGAR